MQSGDCAKLQDTLNGVAFCDPSLEFPEVGQMPAEMLKVFRIAQLTIQYLLHSQDMLAEGVQKLKAESFSIKRVMRIQCGEFRIFLSFRFYDLREINFEYRSFKNAIFSILETEF